MGIDFYLRQWGEKLRITEGQDVDKEGTGKSYIRNMICTLISMLCFNLSLFIFCQYNLLKI